MGTQGNAGKSSYTGIVECAGEPRLIDVDLSTDLAHLSELIRPILSGSVDVAFGSRLLPDSRVVRRLKRSALDAASLPGQRRAAAGRPA